MDDFNVDYCCMSTAYVLAFIVCVNHDQHYSLPVQDALVEIHIPQCIRHESKLTNVSGGDTWGNHMFVKLSMH